MKDTITFEVSGTRYQEPDEIIYGVLIFAGENENNTLEKVDAIAQVLKLEEVAFEADNFLVTGRIPEQDFIKLFSIKSKEVLLKFVEELKTLPDIQGGIVSTSLNNTEAVEGTLIQELLEKANKKAKTFSRLISRKIAKKNNGIINLEIKTDVREKWTAFPPFHNIDRQSMFSAMLMNRRNKEKVEMSRTIVVTYQMV